MKLKHLEYFVEIAEQHSIHKAAEVLYNSQPNLTRAMNSLEEEMGAKLFIRTNQGVKLTDIGEDVYYYAKSIVGQMRTLSDLVIMERGRTQSKLQISVAGLIFADDFMLRFYEQVKSSHTTITLQETTIESVVDHVNNLQSEIGIAVLDEIQLPALRKMLEIKELEMTELDESFVYVHFNKKSSLAKYEEVKAIDLLEYSYIHLPEDHFSNINYSARVSGVQLSDFKKTITMNNYHSIICMLKYMDAFILGNCWQAEELEKGGITSRRIKALNDKRKLVWMKRKKEILSDNAKLFLELVQAHYIHKNI